MRPNHQFLIFILWAAFITVVLNNYRFDYKESILFFIPLCYLILMSFINPFDNLGRHLGFFVFNIISFFRYFFVPLFCISSGEYYHSFIRPSSDYASQLAVYMIIYEMICLLTIQKHFLNKLNKAAEKQNFIVIPFQNRGLLVFGMVGVLSIAIFDEIRSRFNFITIKEYILIELNAVLYTLMLLAGNAFVLIFLWRANIELHKKFNAEKINWFLLIILAFTAISIISTHSRLTVLANAMTIIFVLRKANIAKFGVVVFFIPLVGLMILSMSYFRWFEVSDVSTANILAVEYLSIGQFADYLQAYFSGHHLISAAIDLDYSLPLFTNFESIVNEIFNAVIYLRQLFPLNAENSTVVYNKVFGFTDEMSIILPILGQGYMYFGFFFAPILSVFCLYLLYRSDLSIITSRSLSKLFCFSLLSFWWGFFPNQNLNIVTATFFFKFLPIYSVVIFTEWYLYKEKRISKR